MADGFSGKDFAGAEIPFGAKEIAGKQYPAQVLADPVTGLPQDIAALLVEMNARLSDIADSVANLSPDANSRIRVNAEIVAAHAVTLASLATVTTLTTLTNQAQMGGVALNAYVQHMTLLSEGDLRRNVVIS